MFLKTWEPTRRDCRRRKEGREGGRKEEERNERKGEGERGWIGGREGEEGRGREGEDGEKERGKLVSTHRPQWQTAVDHQYWWALPQRHTGYTHPHIGHWWDTPSHRWDQEGCQRRWLLMPHNSSVGGETRITLHSTQQYLSLGDSVVTD